MPKAIGQITIRDENDISIGTTAPSNPIKDQMWLDTSINPSVLKRYNGSGWDIVNDYSVDIKKAEEKITTNTTSINAINGQIDTLIKDTTIIEDGTTVKLKDSYSNLKQTVSGINATIASHSTSISNLTNNLNAVSGKVTTVENKQATLEQNLSGFKTTVSNTYSTKTELSTVDGKVSSLSSRVSTAESSITQLNNKIALKVEQTDIIDAVNNIQIGGRNLAKNTRYGECITILNYNAGTFSKQIIDINVPFLGVNKVTQINRGSSGGGDYRVPDITINNSVNKIYTVGLWVKSVNASSSFGIRIGVNDKSMTGKTVVLVSNEWTYVSYTKVFSDIDLGTALRVYMNHTINTSVQICLIKVEEGNKSTDWTPAPEDVDQSINNVDGKVSTLNTTVNTVSNKVATIETSLTSITSRVSSTESSITTINGNVSSLQTRMSSAEQKITSSAIISTVQSTINNAKTEAINSANSATDTKLQSYATKASMELTSTQLRLEFKSSGGGNLLKNGRPIRGKRGLANWNCSNSAGSTAVINLGDGGENLNGEVFGSGIWWNGTREPLGSNTWCCLFNNSIANYKFNTSKIYHVSLIIYSSESGKNININIIDSNGYNSVTGYNTTLNSGYQLVQFTFTPAQQGNTPNFGIYLNTPGSYNFYIPWAVVGEGYPVNNWIPNDNEIEDGNTTIDATGVKIYNGALTVLNNNGQVMLQGDSNGNLSFSGRLQPYDYQIRLFGNDCRIDGSAGAIRMQWNPQNYISVENGATRIYDNNSAGGTRYISFATDTEGHANIWSTQTRMKLLGNSSARPVIQSRNISDNSYGDFHGADFLNRSTIKDKTNVQEINDIDFKKLLMENTIKKYNLKTDVETVLDGFGLENTIDEVVASSADIRLGFILEELTQDARAMLSPGNMESISIYSMCSILWKVCQEQQKRIEALENLQ